MEEFDELTPSQIEVCGIAELFYHNPDIMDQEIVMETDEMRAIREISGIDLSIFDVSLNNFFTLIFKIELIHFDFPNILNYNCKSNIYNIVQEDIEIDGQCNEETVAEPVECPPTTNQSRGAETEPLPSTSGGRAPETEPPVPSTSGQTSPSTKRKREDDTEQPTKRRVSLLL